VTGLLFMLMMVILITLGTYLWFSYISTTLWQKNNHNPNVLTQETWSCIPSAGSTCEMKTPKRETNIKSAKHIDYKKEINAELQAIKDNMNKNRKTLKKDNLLVLWNSVYKTKSILYRNISNIKDYKKLRYIKYVLPKGKTIWKNNSIGKIESKLYECNYKQKDNSIVCNRKVDFNKTNINKNMIGNNLYLFSIKVKNGKDNK